MRAGNGAGKGVSCMNKLCSVIDRMNVKLGSKFLNSLSIKTQILKRLQHVIVVGATAPTLKRIVCLYAHPARCSAGSEV